MRAEVNTSTLSERPRFKMPSKGEFTRFRSTPDLKDAEHFLRMLQRDLDHHRVPLADYERVLMTAVSDELIQDWIEKECIQKGKSWEAVKQEFVKRYDDKAITAKLALEFDTRTQKPHESVADYAEAYRKLMTRLKFEETNSRVVDQMHRGLRAEIRTAMKSQREAQKAALSAVSSLFDEDKREVITTGMSDGYTSVNALIQAALAAEEARKPSAGRDFRPAHGDAPPRRARVSRVQAKEKSATEQVQQTVSQLQASVRKLEMSASGVPVNVNPKKRRGGATRKTTQTHDARQKGSNPKKDGRHACYICGSKDHNQFECKNNLRECKWCGRAGHLLVNCTKYDPSKRPRISRLNDTLTTRALAYNEVYDGKMRYAVASKAMPGHVCNRVYLDTGAGFSCINRELVERFKLHVHKPTGHQVLDGADASMRMKRMGYVKIDVTIHYILGGVSASLQCDKIFEIANLKEDFLLGTEMVPHMFPDNDIVHGTVDMDSITSPPTNVRLRREPAKVPRVNKVSSHVWSTKASDAVEAQILDESVLYDAEDEDDGDPPATRNLSATSSTSTPQ